MTVEQIKKEFLAEECDYISAIEMLQENCAMSGREAEALVESWEEDKTSS